MSKNEEKLIVNVSAMGDEELLAFKKHIEEKYISICEKRLHEYCELVGDENFDEYTYFGKKKIKNLFKKYEDDEDGFTYLMEEVLREIKLRQLTIEDVIIDDELEDNITLNDEEFIKKEIEKSEKFKNKKN